MESEKEGPKRINKYFQWTSQHDVLMCREVLVAEPFNLKPRSPERGKVWEKVSSTLNSIEQPKFKVSARAVRDRYSLLTTKQAQKIREEEKATGIEVEQSELDCLLEELLEREKEGKARIESQDVEKVKKAENDKETAEMVRKQAMERMVNTTKKKCDESDNGGKKKVRRTNNDTINYLKEKSSKDNEFKMEELELRKKELELATNKQDQAFQQQQDMLKVMMNQMQQQQQQQQNMQAMFVAQQQQQNKLLMALFENKKQE